MFFFITTLDLPVPQHAKGLIFPRLLYKQVVVFVIVNKSNVLTDHITVIGNILQNVTAITNFKSLSMYAKIEKEDCDTQAVQANQITRQEASRLEYSRLLKKV